MTPEPKFLRRFEQIWAALRRYQARLGLAATVLAAATGLGLLAWADYRLELSRTARAVGLALAGLARRSSSSAGGWSRRSGGGPGRGRPSRSRAGSRSSASGSGPSCSSPACPTTGSTDEGVRPSLVEALEEETEERAAPLPLDRIVRWRRVWALAALAAVPVVLLAVAAIAEPRVADRHPAGPADRAAVHDGRGHARRHPGRPGGRTSRSPSR